MQQPTTALALKYIFVTGGVVSSLGKGLAAASIGALLEGHGYRVALQKFDPYINVDPGTMSPYQHGEVYVTDDGAETDLDLGHYERFTNQVDDAEQQLDHRQDLPVGHPEGAARRLPRAHRPGHPAHHQRDQGQHPRRRQGRRRRHRRDRRHGRRHREPAVPRGHPPVPSGRRTRQHALHPPDAGAVHRRRRRAEDQADAAQRARPARDRHPARHPALPHRSLPRRRTSSGRSRCSATSTRRRSSRPRTSSSIYEVPLVARRRGARSHRPRAAAPAAHRARGWSAGSELVDRIQQPGRRAHHPRRRQVRRLRGLVQEPQRGALPRRLQAPAVKVNIRWVEAEALEAAGGEQLLDGANGILVPGGFGDRGTRGMMRAAEIARERGIPYFGICYGFQWAAVEYARHVCGLARRRLHRVRARHAAQRDLQAARPARRGRSGRHDAARIVRVRAEGRIAGAARSTATT